MADQLTITSLEFWTHIGCTEEERSQEQRLLIDIALKLDATAAGKSDALEDSIDYEAVTNAVKDLQKTERQTVEKLASEVADVVLKQFKPAAVTVTVHKFILPGTKEVKLTITRP